MSQVADGDVRSSPSVAALSGFIIGMVVVYFGILVKLSEPLAAKIPLDPLVPALAAALAAAIAAQKSGASVLTTLGLALGGAVAAYFVSMWLMQWLHGDAYSRNRISPALLILKRDVTASVCGVALGSVVGALFGRV